MSILFIVHLIFQVYTLLLIARVLSSWFPQYARHKIVLFLAYYVDPYLNIFRRIIPPIGGVLDLSPLIAFFGLRFLEWLVIKLII